MKKDQGGWIKVYRKLTDSEIWTMDDPFDKRSAWIDLLLSVNHEDRDVPIRNDVIKVRAGQTWTSVRKLAKRWNWSEKKTLAYLRQLEMLKMITRDGTHKGTLITVVKYRDFQGAGNTKGNTTDNAKET